MRTFRAWWAWLDQVQIIIRWPRAVDWTDEGVGPVR